MHGVHGVLKCTCFTHRCSVQFNVVCEGIGLLKLPSRALDERVNSSTKGRHGRCIKHHLFTPVAQLFQLHQRSRVSQTQQRAHTCSDIAAARSIFDPRRAHWLKTVGKFFSRILFIGSSSSRAQSTTVVISRVFSGSELSSAEDSTSMRRQALTTT